MSLRVIIVDDEAIARRRLRRFLAEDDEVAIVAECADGTTAIEAIAQKVPDAVFLDVQMPKPNGLEVLSALDPNQRPVVIFVTAFDQYALHAFEAEAVDYLLKPFGGQRVRQALRRARTFLHGDARKCFQERLASLLERTSESRPPSCLLIKGTNRVVLLRPADIDWVEADGDYVRFYRGQESHLHRATLTEMERRLKLDGFVRIHRSRLVNLDRIREFKPFFRGQSLVVLKNGVELAASQPCLKELHYQLLKTV